MAFDIRSSVLSIRMSQIAYLKTNYTDRSSSQFSARVSAQEEKKKNVFKKLGSKVGSIFKSKKEK